MCVSLNFLYHKKQILTGIVRFEVQNIRLSGESIHVFHLVVFILIAVNQVDHVIPSSGAKMAFNGTV